MAQFDELGIVAVSDNITQLTRMTLLGVRAARLSFFFFLLTLAWQLDSNAFSEFPTSVLVLTQLTYLAVRSVADSLTF